VGIAGRQGQACVPVGEGTQQADTTQHPPHPGRQGMRGVHIVPSGAPTSSSISCPLRSTSSLMRSPTCLPVTRYLQVGCGRHPIEKGSKEHRKQGWLRSREGGWAGRWPLVVAAARRAAETCAGRQMDSRACPLRPSPLLSPPLPPLCLRKSLKPT
jgi:hypothetical protein